MAHNIKHKCSRRRTAAAFMSAAAAVTPSPAAPPGGGSGGGPEEGGRSHFFDGTYCVAANKLQFISRPPLPPAEPSPFIISLLAAGTGADGLVQIRGSQGVRMTAGPPMLPPGGSDSTNGVEVVVGEAQQILLQRGLLPGIDQQIQMQPGQITVDGGAGLVTVQSLSMVKLSVAGGVSSITLTPAGIIIEGPLVMIN